MSFDVWIGYLSSTVSLDAVAPSTFEYHLRPLRRLDLDPDSDYEQLTLVDGVGDVDDTVSLAIATDDEDPIGDADGDGQIVVIGLAGRLFGPYDVETISADAIMPACSSPYRPEGPVGSSSPTTLLGIGSTSF